MGALVEFQATGRGGPAGRAFIDPASVVSVAVVDGAGDSVYIELTSGNTFNVSGPVESVLEALGRS